MTSFAQCHALTIRYRPANVGTVIVCTAPRFGWQYCYDQKPGHKGLFTTPTTPPSPHPSPSFLLPLTPRAPPWWTHQELFCSQLAECCYRFSWPQLSARTRAHILFDLFITKREMHNFSKFTYFKRIFFRKFVPFFFLDFTTPAAATETEVKAVAAAAS